MLFQARKPLCCLTSLAFITLFSFQGATSSEQSPLTPFPASPKTSYRFLAPPLQISNALLVWNLIRGRFLPASFEARSKHSISWMLRFDFKWWRLAGSNRWPPACKAGALPAELYPQIPLKRWWAQVDSNHRPYDYQSYALTSWAMGPSWVSRACTL